MTDNFETDIIERQRLAIEYLLESIERYLLVPTYANKCYLKDAYQQVSSASTMTVTSKETEE